MKAIFGLSLTVLIASSTAVMGQIYRPVDTSLLWDLGYDGKGTAIAFIDGAIDDSHPFLRDKVVLQACFAPSEGLQCGKDARKLETGEVADDSAHAAECSDSDKREIGCRHTTVVAGIAAGAMIKDAPAVSIAKGSSIVAVKVISSEGTATLASILRGLTWITAKVKEQRSTGSGPNIVAVNMSLGSGSFSAACDADGQYAGVLRRIRELKGEGVAVFAAAGNNSENGVTFPACMSDVIAVGAIDKNDRVSSFSNYSSLITLFSPGQDIVSSVGGGGYEASSGTSMATAVASGAFALLMGAFPEMDVDTITTALKVKGREITVPQTNATVRAIDVASSYAFLRILASEREEAEQAQRAPGVAR